MSHRFTLKRRDERRRAVDGRSLVTSLREANGNDSTRILLETQSRRLVIPRQTMEHAGRSRVERYVE